MNRTLRVLFVVFVLAGLAGCGRAEDGGVAAAEAPLVEGGGLPRDVVERLADIEGCDDDELDRVRTLEYDVRVGRGRYVHVTERFTLRAWTSWPHRGVLLLPGTVVTGSFYELDVEGYDFQSELARHGLFTFAIDSEGSGDSTYPADGLSVTHSFLVDEARSVLAAVRRLRAIPRVDVLGESNGGAIAAELCADRAATRSCTMASMLYAEGTPFFNAVFLDPGFLAFLESQPNGYIDVGPELYFNITLRTAPDVTAAILATQPGVYAVAPLIAPADGLPWFDPTHARVPGLVIMGTEDDIATQADGDALVAAYGSAHRRGGTATLVRIPGAGHVPRIEPSPVADAYRDAVLDFLDPPR